MPYTLCVYTKKKEAPGGVVPQLLAHTHAIYILYIYVFRVMLRLYGARRTHEKCEINKTKSKYAYVPLPPPPSAYSDDDASNIMWFV